MDNQANLLCETVQKNCDISDARHAANYTLCVYLLKMREYFRWENGYSYDDILPKEDIGNWVQERECLWEKLEEENYIPLFIDGKKFDPFDTENINQALASKGYVYSGGIGLRAAPHFFLGKLETPFFYEKDHSFALYPLVFMNKTMELRVNRYRNTPNSWPGAFSFYWKAGLPLFLHDDYNMVKYKIYRKIGIIPKPTSAQEGLVKYVYKEINSVAEEYGAKVVIVVLREKSNPVEVNEQLFPPYALFVNAQDALQRAFTFGQYLELGRGYCATI